MGLLSFVWPLDVEDHLRSTTWGSSLINTCTRGFLAEVETLLLEEGNFFPVKVRKKWDDVIEFLQRAGQAGPGRHSQNTLR